jgi:hypothetical protein
MRNDKRKFGWMFTGLVTLALLLVGSIARAQNISWNVKISPKGGGQVVWHTSSPSASGTLTASGKITFDSGAYVDLTFQANTGYELQLVLKNADDWTSYLDGSHHYQFGPVTSAHTITTLFSALVPTGTFGLAFPTSGTLTPVYDVSGNYTGTSPTKYARAYNMDVAMDEFGKVEAMGTVSGITPEGGGELSGQVGSIKTVNNQPVASLKGNFKGTRDGADATGSGAVSGSVVPTDIGGGTNGFSATGSYKGKAAGVSYSDSKVPVQAPLTPSATANLTKAWTIQIVIHKTTVKSKVVTLASGLLTLPNGDQISYPDKPAKYSATKGYKLTFKGGTNITRSPNAPDKKSSVKITGMTMAQAGSDWVINGGTISYQFLGQKGTGNLTDFLP